MTLVLNWIPLCSCTCYDNSHCESLFFYIVKSTIMSFDCGSNEKVLHSNPIIGGFVDKLNGSVYTPMA